MSNKDYPPDNIEETKKLIQELEDKMASDKIQADKDTAEDEAMIQAAIDANAPPWQIDAMRKAMGKEEETGSTTNTDSEPKPDTSTNNEDKEGEYKENEPVKPLDLGDGTLEDKRTPEQKVNEARAKYTKEYLKCKKEVRNKVAINRAKASIFNIFKSKDNKEIIKEEDYFTKEFKEAKVEYNKARVEMGNEMFNEMKTYLEGTGLRGADLDNALTRYKATVILEKVIIDERNKLIKAKAEGSPTNPTLLKKVMKGYMNLKPWQKRALGISLFMAAAGTGIVGAGAYAGYSLGAMAGIKWGASLGIGVLTRYSSKGIDYSKKGADKKFEQKQEIEKSTLGKEFGSGDITLEQLEKTVEGFDEIEEDKRKRIRDRMILKAGVGMGIALLAGGATSHAVAHFGDHVGTIGGNAVNESLTQQEVQTPTEGTAGGNAVGENVAQNELKTDTPPDQTGTEPELPVVEQPDTVTEVEQPAVEVPAPAVKAPAVDNLETPKPKIDEIKIIKPKEGIYTPTYPKDIPSNTPPVKSQFEMDNPQEAPKAPAINKSGLSEFEKANPQQDPDSIKTSSTVDAKSQFETENPQVSPENASVNNTNPTNLSDFEKETPQVAAPSALDQNIPKISTSQFELDNNQVPPQATAPVDINESSTPRVPIGDIKPTEGIYTPGGSPDAGFNSNTDGPNDNGFTREVDLTTKESQVDIGENESIYSGTRAGGSYETTSTGSTMKMETIENDPRNLETIKELRKEIGRHSFKNDVIVVKPDSETINNIEYNKFNDATDYTFKAKQVEFNSYESYEKERELQALFGDVREVTRGGNKFIDMEYFREIPEWKIANKIPAKYFFDFDNAKVISGDKLVDIPKADLQKLVDKGIIEDQVVEINGVPTHAYTFTNRTELLRLSDTYEKWNSEGARPIGNETIERYVARITKDVHQTDDGTFFVLKKDVVLKNSGIVNDGRVVDLENNTVRSINNNRITPTNYNSGNYYYSQNYRFASRVARIFTGRMSDPVPMSTPVRLTR